MARYRIIHALRLDLGPIPDGAPNSRRELVVNLTREGTNQRKDGCRPRPPKTRIVDLRPGDDILHDGRWCKVYDIRPFLASWLTEKQALGALGKGYVYRVRENASPE